MQTARAVASATVLCILVVTILSGPLVGAVDLTPEAQSTPEPPIGSGALDVSVQSVPTEGVTLEKGQYGSQSFYLHVPDAQVQVESVSGQPMIVYKIRIPELGYSSGTTAFLSESNVGNHTLHIQRKALAPDRVKQESYDAELIILVRAGGEEAELVRQPVTVEVKR